MKEYDAFPLPSEEDIAAADEHLEIIALSQGITDDGKPYWAYVTIAPSKFKEFSQAASPIKLTDYGTVIRAGIGDEPPQDVRDEMEVNINADHSIQEQILTISENMAKEREIRERYKID